MHRTFTGGSGNIASAQWRVPAGTVTFVGMGSVREQSEYDDVALDHQQARHSAVVCGQALRIAASYEPTAPHAAMGTGVNVGVTSMQSPSTGHTLELGAPQYAVPVRHTPPAPPCSCTQHEPAAAHSAFVMQDGAHVGRASCTQRLPSAHAGAQAFLQYVLSLAHTLPAVP